MSPRARTPAAPHRPGPSAAGRPGPAAHRVDAIRAALASSVACAPGVVSSGWAGLDRSLGGLLEGGPVLGDPVRGGGLVRGAIHEWLGLEAPGAAAGSGLGRRAAGAARAWSPPLFILAHLARRALEQRLAEPGCGAAMVCWIGRRVWPYPRALVDGTRVREAAGERPAARASATEHALLVLELVLLDGADTADTAAGTAADTDTDTTAADDRQLLDHSILLDPADDDARLWAIDAALRCPSVTAVVADGSGLSMAATRRLQLTAADGACLALLARPPSETRALSAATTRWSVRRSAPLPRGAAAALTRAATNDTVDDTAGTSAGTSAGAPGWTVELLRAKGTQRLHRARDPQPG